MNLERTLKQWAGVVPSAIASSSPAAVTFFAEDAQKDIAALGKEIDELGRVADSRKVIIAAKDAEIKELRAKLFPYADATEISGVSWDGKYLIGDKASIKFFHEMKNRGEQMDVYKRAYDQNLAAKDAEIAIIAAQNEWLKDRISNLQLPSNSQKNIEEWLVECGMPVALKDQADV